MVYGLTEGKIWLLTQIRDPDIPADVTVTVPSGAITDTYGNSNTQAAQRQVHYIPPSPVGAALGITASAIVGTSMAASVIGGLWMNYLLPNTPAGEHATAVQPCSAKSVSVAVCGPTSAGLHHIVRCSMPAEVSPSLKGVCAYVATWHRWLLVPE